MDILKIWNYKIYVSEKNDWNAKNKEWVFKKFYTFKEQPAWDKFIVFENLFDETKIDLWDAMILNIANIKVAVRLADCNWIVILWKKYFAIVHAWWRWVKNRILFKVLNEIITMWEEKEYLQFYIWPSIRSCCFEVWDEFKEYFPEKYFENKNEKLFVNLVHILNDELKDFWIKSPQIILNDYCTKCSDIYFSHRNWNKERFIVWVEKIAD